jgi:hypothetical protein
MLRDAVFDVGDVCSSIFCVGQRNFEGL